MRARWLVLYYYELYPSVARPPAFFVHEACEHVDIFLLYRGYYRIVLYPADASSDAYHDLGSLQVFFRGQVRLSLASIPVLFHSSQTCLFVWILGAWWSQPTRISPWDSCLWEHCIALTGPYSRHLFPEKKTLRAFSWSRPLCCLVLPLTMLLS